jgi:hypothetical protein
MNDRNWIQKNWGFPEAPITILFKKIEELEQKLVKLEEKNVETTNCLYENYNTIDAVNFRIDILSKHCGIIEDA